ncbi:hypothetical protein PRK78_003330 [Emydomyces testavorans]|uniref:Uncharacterized protein n=1 Tax=Emydomyces testavorans TaxID=2070801 RepID=A0AAF0DGM3_9EURO|nr:hypothetical protein PRK78_003330 [Emydomyces testavorans]
MPTVQLSRLPSSERSRAHLLSVSSKPVTSNETGTSHNIRVLHPDPLNEEASWDGLRQRPFPTVNQTEPPKTPTELEPATLSDTGERSAHPGHITFSSDTFNKPNRGKALRIPGPREFERADMTKSIHDVSTASPSDAHRKLPAMERLLSRAASFEHAASSAFIIGGASRTRSRSRSRGPISRTSSRATTTQALPYLSYNPTIGRNSKFLGLTEEQKEELGGIEYRSLRLLLKIAGDHAQVILSFFTFSVGSVWLHGYGIRIENTGITSVEIVQSTLLGGKKRFVLSDSDTFLINVLRAFYSSQTTFNNLGFTLTPDSMISFRDATFPMLWMTFLIYVGNTAYPIVLRFVIWVAFRLTPENSAIKEPLNFLLDHPRRCYTVLFPSKVTWVLFGSLVLINGFDVILFLILDLHYAEVTMIKSGWHRFCAALFQTASARTSGTSSFTVAKIHPAAQFSLMGVFDDAEELLEIKRTSYLGVHIKMQLAFDLWYVFLGVFVIAIAEGSHIADINDPVSQFLLESQFHVDIVDCNLTLNLGIQYVLGLVRSHFRLWKCRPESRPSSNKHCVNRPIQHRGQIGDLRHDDSWQAPWPAIILPGEKRIIEEDARIDGMGHDLSRRHTR